MPSFSAHPFNFFLILAALNALLAYSNLNWPIKLIAAVLGFGTLGWVYLKNRAPEFHEEPPLFSRDIYTPAPWLLILTFMLALVARLYKLSTFLAFPIVDEIISAYNAIHMNSHWTWPFFYYASQTPALNLWVLSAAIKFLGFSFPVLWLVPAIFSFLSIIFYYLAFRVFFSRFFSYVCLLLLGLTFWPVFIGRFSHNGPLMVFFQALTFWILAKFVRADPNRKHIGLSILLGFFLGLGFYTYFAWLLVALCVVLTLGGYFRNSWSSRKKDLVICMMVAFFTVLPLIIAALKENFGTYIGMLFVFNKKGNETFSWHYWQNAFLFTNFFWTGWPKFFSYNSGWGGLLNPILGSFFFLGVLEWWRLRQYPMAKWMAVSAAVLFLPCLLANDTNGYHMASLLPIFIAMMALGLSVVLESLPKAPVKLVIIFPVLILSICLDYVTLDKSMAHANRNFNVNNPMVALCESLNKINQTSGPGLIYTT